MELVYKPTAVKQFKKLPRVEQTKIIRKLELLLEDPNAGKLLKGELADLYFFRAWPYRIIYEIVGKKIIIYSIAHRQSAYS